MFGFSPLIASIILVFDDIPFFAHPAIDLIDIGGYVNMCLTPKSYKDVNIVYLYPDKSRAASPVEPKDKPSVIIYASDISIDFSFIMSSILFVINFKTGV